MNEQLLLHKWQNLDPDDQEKVIAFMDELQQKKADYQPKTELGKKLRNIESIHKTLHTG
jgi:hypothetical protein